MRRLIDLPGIADLETKALMKPRYAEPEAREEFPEIDACSTANFGITADEAADLKPADWDGVDRLPLRDQIEAFEAAGWDVTDAKRRPLRMFGHFNLQLWLAVRGVAGSLPFEPEKPGAADLWGGSLAAEAAKFRRDRR